MLVKGQTSLSQVERGNAQKIDLLLDFRPDAALSGADRPPLNISIVMDRSGSMGGGRIRHAIRAAQSLVDQLADQDTISVVSYDDNIRTVLAPRSADDKDAIKSAIGQIRPGGLTNLSGGWEAGCTHVAGNQSPGAISRVLLLTDGQANRGTTDPAALARMAGEKAASGVITTTLGFGNGFNEDLLIGMAESCGGAFYFIQSNDDAREVFDIEVQGLSSIFAQNLEVHLALSDGVQLGEVLHHLPMDDDDGDELLELGDVYKTEGRQVAVELTLPAFAGDGEVTVLVAQYSYDVLVDGALERRSGELPVTIQVGDSNALGEAQTQRATLEQLSRLRIGRAKDAAVKLADSGDMAAANKMLRDAIETLRSTVGDSSFEFAEELDALDHYAKMIDKQHYNQSIRKEIRDQSYQARSRNRPDLQLRGASSGDTTGLDAVTAATGDEPTGILVRCIREGGKLRVMPVSDGYNKDHKVQFPRAIRQEGCTYLVEELVDAGSFYRARGEVKLLLRPGQSRPAAPGASRRRSNRNLRPIKATRTAADLPTTGDIGDGVLVQCVQEGRRKKLRARVVSDGYNPDLNMSFPRSIREVGVLYVVEEVRLVSSGKSYRAYGDIRRLVSSPAT
jgi:Ca-activated chloride channel family protein